MEKNRTTVVIDGREYPVASVESVEHIQQVAKLVDDKVREIRTQQSVLNPQVALAFAALNLADELVNLQQKLRPDGESGDFVKRKRVYRRVKK